MHTDRIEAIGWIEESLTAGEAGRSTDSEDMLRQITLKTDSYPWAITCFVSAKRKLR